MKFSPQDPPRAFVVGDGIELRDCGRLELAPDEQVTFTTPAGGELDVTRKAWGFYATPSTNRRLAKLGLRAALAKGRAGGLYVLLAERGHEPAFQAYLEQEALQLLSWLDRDEDVDRLQSLLDPGPAWRCPCGGGAGYDVLREFEAPPAGETRFPSLPPEDYRRALWQCRRCDHVLAVHELDLVALYAQDYVDATYQGTLSETYARIMGLPPESSDNRARVARVVAWLDQRLPPSPRRALDVGSGLCVFLAVLQEHGWEGTALDPDARAVAHAREVAGVAQAVRGELGKSAPPAGLGRYELISFNKVLEHVPDPAPALRQCHDLLAPGGFVYLELPDAVGALREGPEREEFFVEHYHAFSDASLALLARRAGFDPCLIERVHEPSGKYTLRAFLAPRAREARA